MPYLIGALKAAKDKFEVIDKAESSLDLPKLEEKGEIGPDGNGLLDCAIKGMNWNPHSKGKVGAFMEYQQTFHMLGPDIDNKNMKA